MATSSSSPAPRRSVVRSLASAVDRPCARPGCPAPARATLTFSYASREVLLDRLTEEDQPQGYDLCGPHAGRTDPPRGWQLEDRRPAEDTATPAPRVENPDLGGEATVAVLAAALRAVPTPLEAPPAAPPEPARLRAEDLPGAMDEVADLPPPVPPGAVTGTIAPVPTEPPPPAPVRADDADAPAAPFQVPAARDR